jgi:23S rRNA pseudouridine1911/1915/1917 synthase
MSKNNTFKAASSIHNMRLDKALATVLDQHSRTDILKSIKHDLVTVNGKVEKPSYKVVEGDLISIDFVEKPTLSATPQKMDLNIVFEDEHIIIINKPAGLVTHPSFGHVDNTLVNGLLYHSRCLSSIGGTFRPGIVHRLDKDTSGLLLVAKTDQAHLFLATQLATKAIKRYYYALVNGVIPVDGGKIDAPIGRHPTSRQKQAVNLKNGKDAITHFKVINRYQDKTFIECELETGRTHQIRVHLSYINHPIINDGVYGHKYKNQSLKGQMLHAYKLVLVHPVSKKKVTFKIPLPDYFSVFLNDLTPINR